MVFLLITKDSPESRPSGSHKGFSHGTVSSGLLLTRILAKSIFQDALGKLIFFAYVISRKRRANQQRQLQNDAFHVKTSQSAKK